MNWTNFLSSPWPYLTTTALAVLIGWYVWKQPLRPGTRYFRWLVCIWFIWSVVAALHNLTPSLSIRYVLWVVQGICPLLGPPLVLMIVLEYTGNEKWLARRSLNLLFLPALLGVVLSVFWPNAIGTIENHSGFQVFVGSNLVRWGFYAYFVAVMLSTTIVLFACLLRSPAFWAPLSLLILGRIIPIIGYLVPNPQQLSVPPIQTGLLFLDITIVLYFVALYSFQILRISPVARDTVISRMPYSLLVLDAENRLVDFNASAQTLPGVPGKLTRRQPISQQLPGWWNQLVPLVGPEIIFRDVEFSNDTDTRIFHVTSLPLLQVSGRLVGQAFLLEDVTLARQAEQQQAQAQQAMATLQERDLLARELHDELAQELALINLQAQLASDLLEMGQTEQARTQLQLLAKEARQAQVDVRGEISKLLHSMTTGEGFHGALRRFIHTFQETHGIAAEFILPQNQTLISFKPSTEVQLLRIIQEAFTNIRKHSQATRVRIVLTKGPECAELTVKDNGIGFESDRLPAVRQTYGLGIMSERAKEFNGRIEINSRPGEGTKITVLIPTNDKR